MVAVYVPGRSTADAGAQPVPSRTAGQTTLSTALPLAATTAWAGSSNACPATLGAVFGTAVSGQPPDVQTMSGPELTVSFGTSVATATRHAVGEVSRAANRTGKPGRGAVPPAPAAVSETASPAARQGRGTAAALGCTVGDGPVPGEPVAGAAVALRGEEPGVPVADPVVGGAPIVVPVASGAPIAGGAPVGDPAPTVEAGEALEGAVETGAVETGAVESGALGRADPGSVPPGDRVAAGEAGDGTPAAGADDGTGEGVEDVAGAATAGPGGEPATARTAPTAAIASTTNSRTTTRRRRR